MLTLLLFFFLILSLFFLFSSFQVQITIDIVFLVDFGLSFRTGFVRPDNEVELNQGTILTHYLKSWFAIDLAACFRTSFFVVLLALLLLLLLHLCVFFTLSSSPPF